MCYTITVEKASLNTRQALLPLSHSSAFNSLWLLVPHRGKGLFNHSFLQYHLSLIFFIFLLLILTVPCDLVLQLWLFLLLHSSPFSFSSDTHIHTHTNVPSAISLQESSQLCVVAQLRSTFVLVFCMVTSIASVCTKHRDIEVFSDLACLRQLLFSLVPVSFNLPVTTRSIWPSPFCFARVPEWSCLPSSHLSPVFSSCLHLF